MKRKKIKRKNLLGKKIFASKGFHGDLYGNLMAEETFVDGHLIIDSDLEVGQDVRVDGFISGNLLGNVVCEGNMEVHGSINLDDHLFIGNTKILGPRQQDPGNLNSEITLEKISEKINQILQCLRNHGLCGPKQEQQEHE